MRFLVLRGTLALIMVLGTAAGAFGQADPTRLRIAPVVGWYTPTQKLGVVAGEDESIRLNAESSPSLGAAVETTVPGTGIQVRGQLLYAPSTGVSASRVDRFEPCGTDCSRAVYTSDPLAAGSVVLAIADAVVPLSRFGPVRLYGVAGGGARKYSFDLDQLGLAYSDALSDESARFVAHLGLGVSVNAGPVELTAEAGDYLGRYRVMGGEGAWMDNTQHDVGVTLGIRRGIR